MRGVYIRHAAYKCERSKSYAERDTSYRDAAFIITSGDNRESLETTLCTCVCVRTLLLFFSTFGRMGEENLGVARGDV